MISARAWHGVQLLAAWLSIPAAYVLFRALLVAGVYEATIEGQRVTLVSGFWSTGFASTLSWVGAVAGFSLLVWLTFTWAAGLKSRARLEAMTESPYRRPLM
ncbi:MAG: hypothetical protein OEN56_07885 [Gemmatimonadota bacterium]|nr:hypothetical protein [Gemmatimonadota bacterium]